MKDEMDILKEVGNTAAAHGSTALSKMIGKTISLSVPSVDIISVQDIKEKMKMNIEGSTIALQTQIISGMHGKIMFVLDEKDAFRKTRENSTEGCYANKIGFQ